MIDKRCGIEAALRDIPDGASILVGGFGEVGTPLELINALIERRLRDLTIISNNGGAGRIGLAALLASGAVRKLICSYPRSPGSEVFDQLYRDGKIELELVPQGTLAERIRAAGAGVGAFYTATSVGTPLAQGKETRVIGGREQVLEYALQADYSLVKAKAADRWGNLVYSKTARNFGPIMCMAAKKSIVQVSEIVELGELDPEQIVTPSIFVHRVVHIENSARSAAARIMETVQ